MTGLETAALVFSDAWASEGAARAELQRARDRGASLAELSDLKSAHRAACSLRSQAASDLERAAPPRLRLVRG